MTRQEVERYLAQAKCGRRVLVGPDDLTELCRARLREIDVTETVERLRSTAATEREPTICDLCGEVIKPGSATFASIEHWSCHERVRGSR